MNWLLWSLVAIHNCHTNDINHLPIFPQDPRGVHLSEGDRKDYIPRLHHKNLLLSFSSSRDGFGLLRFPEYHLLMIPNTAEAENRLFANLITPMMKCDWLQNWLMIPESQRELGETTQASIQKRSQPHADYKSQSKVQRHSKPVSTKRLGIPTASIQKWSDTRHTRCQTDPWAISLRVGVTQLSITQIVREIQATQLRITEQSDPQDSCPFRQGTSPLQGFRRQRRSFGNHKTPQVPTTYQALEFSRSHSTTRYPFVITRPSWVGNLHRLRSWEGVLRYSSFVMNQQNTNRTVIQPNAEERGKGKAKESQTVFLFVESSQIRTNPINISNQQPLFWWR